MSRAVPTGWLALASLWFVAAGATEPKSVPVDADFLEFLGTFEPQDEGIDEYLATQAAEPLPAKKAAPARIATQEVSK